MTRKSIVLGKILPLAIAAAFAAPLAQADVPKAVSAPNVRDMDTNKNGRVEKSEYIAYMTAAFDRAAGSKGYCTFEEVQAGFAAFVANP